ncbi:MAG: phage tail protein [Pseudomonadota bacterium]|nr:phage tail protein [Pseudomonadota bacterium]
MDRVFTSGAAASPPSAPAFPSTGYATAGSPVGGIPATTPGPWWYHMITEELRAVVSAAGLTPNHTNLTQLSAAIAALISGITPVGSVIYVAKSTAPTGYLKANGAAISRTTYAALFAAIGTVFGAGDGSTTFNLPDLRGEFVRGWADDGAVDSGRVLGSAQADDIKAHTHTLPQASTGGGFITGTGDPSGSTGLSTGATGGTETRPRNIALLACIKY